VPRSQIYFSVIDEEGERVEMMRGRRWRSPIRKRGGNAVPESEKGEGLTPSFPG
jgi:hypothetical protein